MAPLSDGLRDLQADYLVFYQKARAYHWTARGPMFFALHAKFEEMYVAAAERGDDLAERLLAVGDAPLLTLKAHVDRTRLGEAKECAPAQEMVADLADDLAELTDRARALMGVAEAAEDPGTGSLLQDIADAQEKEVWMLRAFLAE